MNLHISTTEHGELITGTIHYGTALGPEEATTSYRVAAFLYDGLLWCALTRKLAAFTACVVPPVVAVEHINTAISVAERLLAYMRSAPFHTADDASMARILATVAKYLPELAPLTKARPDLASEHAELRALFAIIRDRIAHSGVAGHGLAGMLNPAAQAA